MNSTSVFILCLVALALNTFVSTNEIARGVVESCPGCSLNRKPEVKKFIYEDLPKYENVEFIKIQGALPELVLLNEADDEIERIALSGLNREQCNKLLLDKGFRLTNTDDVIILDDSFKLKTNNEL